MFDFWRRALFFPFSMLLLSLLLWAVAGALPAALFFAAMLLLYFILHLRQLGALDHWLKSPEARSVPDGAGIWEDIFAQLNKMMRLQRKEREQHTAALQHMEQATSALPEGVVILDEADRIEWCNPIAEQHFGLDGTRDIGQQITYLARQPGFVEYLGTKNYNQPAPLGVRRESSPGGRAPRPGPGEG